jgi:hypothetical protein
MCAARESNSVGSLAVVNSKSRLVADTTKSDILVVVATFCKDGYYIAEPSGGNS